MGRSMFFVPRGYRHAKIRADTFTYLSLPPPTALPVGVTPRKKKLLPSNDHFRPFTLSKFPRYGGDDDREIAESWGHGMIEH